MNEGSNNHQGENFPLIDIAKRQIVQRKNVGGQMSSVENVVFGTCTENMQV